MNRHQIRTLRNAILRDRNSNYHTVFKKFELPFLRKKITEIKIGGKKINFDKDVCFLYRLTKGDNTYDLFSVEFKGSGTLYSSETLYIITKNDLIIYWVTSSIFAPAIDAFHLLTEVYHGYRDKDAIYQWKSVEDFNCADMRMIEERRKNWNQPWYKNLLSEYQEKMFAKHKLYFIDKRFITQEEADELASKLYYHT